MKVKIIAWYKSLSPLNQLTLKYAWEMYSVLFGILGSMATAVVIMVLSRLVFNTIFWGIVIDILLLLILAARQRAREKLTDIEDELRYKSRLDAVNQQVKETELKYKIGQTEFAKKLKDY